MILRAVMISVVALSLWAPNVFAAKAIPNVGPVQNGIGITTAFAHFVKEGSYDKAYALLSDAARNKWNQEDLRKAVENESVFTKDLASEQTVKMFSQPKQVGAFTFVEVKYLAVLVDGVKALEFEVVTNEKLCFIENFKIVPIGKETKSQTGANQTG